jgi:hypothetical protein
MSGHTPGIEVTLRQKQFGACRLVTSCSDDYSDHLGTSVRKRRMIQEMAVVFLKN